MTVRAKFQLTEITQWAWSPVVKKLKFQPNYDKDIPEDQRFALTTPNGEFWMQVDNPVALAQLELGKYYYIDITSVPSTTEETTK